MTDDAQLGAGGQVPAHHPDVTARLGQAVRQVLEPVGRDVVRERQSDHQGGGAGAHRGDVGKVLHRRTEAHVPAGGPAPPEVLPVDEDVGGDHHAPVGCRDHGGVVTRSQQGVATPRQAGHDPGQQAVLVHGQSRYRDG